MLINKLFLFSFLLIFLQKYLRKHLASFLYLCDEPVVVEVHGLEGPLVDRLTVAEFLVRDPPVSIPILAVEEQQDLRN